LPPPWAGGWCDAGRPRPDRLRASVPVRLFARRRTSFGRARAGACGRDKRGLHLAWNPHSRTAAKGDTSVSRAHAEQTENAAPV
jgi:hypothetical protein